MMQSLQKNMVNREYLWCAMASLGNQRCSFIDQLANVIEMIKPILILSRLIVSAWNPGRCAFNGVAALSHYVSILCK